MKLYDTPLAPNPRRVRWFMAEKAIDDVEVITLNIMEGQHKTPDYLGKAGLANVPMLEMDDGTLHHRVGRNLPLPGEPLPRAQPLSAARQEETAVIEMWMRRAEMMVATPVMIGVRHTHPAMGALEQQVPAVGEHNLETGTRALKLLDRRLGEKRVAGHRPADDRRHHRLRRHRLRPDDQVPAPGGTDPRLPLGRGHARASRRQGRHAAARRVIARRE
jgi:glutathione S-transferase